MTEEKSISSKLFISYSIFAFLSVFCLVLSFLSNSTVLFCFDVFVLFCMIAFYIKFCFTEKNIIQPIVVVNLLIFMMFVVRPIFVYYYGLDNLIKISSGIKWYNYSFGINNIRNLPHTRAISIVLIGSLAINIGYFGFKKRTIDQIKKFSYSNVRVNSLGFIVYFLFIILFAGIFFARYSFTTLIENAGRLTQIGIDLNFYDLIWLYAFPFLIGISYILSIKNNKFPIMAIVLFGIELLLLTAISRRGYAINVFILIFLINFFSNDNPKFKLEYIFIGLLAIIIVLSFASVRHKNVGKNNSGSVIIEIINEFDMYDMLICSIDYYDHNDNLYNGINYLAFPFIPNFLWENKPNYFDVYNSQIVLNGYFKAGIPTSIIRQFVFEFWNTNYGNNNVFNRKIIQKNI